MSSDDFVAKFVDDQGKDLNAIYPEHNVLDIRANVYTKNLNEVDLNKVIDINVLVSDAQNINDTAKNNVYYLGKLLKNVSEYSSIAVDDKDGLFDAVDKIVLINSSINDSLKTIIMANKELANALKTIDAIKDKNKEITTINDAKFTNMSSSERLAKLREMVENEIDKE